MYECEINLQRILRLILKSRSGGGFSVATLILMRHKLETTPRSLHQLFSHTLTKAFTTFPAIANKFFCYDNKIIHIVFATGHWGIYGAGDPQKKWNYVLRDNVKWEKIKLKTFFRRLT